MIDIHTHILHGVDDGAKDIGMSLEMLRIEKEQGIDTVVLTPHFYRDEEDIEVFLSRRDAAFAELNRAIADNRDDFPELILGCEVAWVPNLSDIDGIERLCIGNSKYMLLELPFFPWSEALCRQLHSLIGRTGVTPLLAHMERYMRLQRPDIFDEILSMGLPVQIGADAICRFLTRGGCLRALGDWAHVVASDCHNLKDRAPTLGEAMWIIRKKLGDAAADEIIKSSYYLAGIEK